MAGIMHGTTSRPRRVLVPLIIFAGIVLGAGCGRQAAKENLDYLGLFHSLKLDQYMGIEPASTFTPTDSVWEENDYDPASPARCLEGTPFTAYVRRGTSNNVLLFLEGGGACWDYQTCYGAGSLAKPVAGPVPDAPGNFQGGGFLDPSDPRNPFRDWNVVYASYCDGSVWSGDSDPVYTNGTGTDSRPTHHHGLANLSAAVTLMKEKFPFPDKVLVSGVSAGGYGTLMGYMVTKLQYPTAPIYVLNDSGPDLVNPANPTLMDQAMKNWQFDKFLPKGVNCPKCFNQLLYIVNFFLTHDPILRYGLTSHYHDAVIGQVFLGMTPDAYQDLLVGVTNDIHSMQPERFKRFFVDGTFHTALTYSAFYSLTVQGVPLYEWTGDLVNDSPDWQDLLQ